ncbi:hypothetical protein [Flexivirga sp. B27]
MSFYAGVVDNAATELRRVTRRWHQLPADQARENACLLRELAQQLADEVRRQDGLERLVIPDLGEAALADQLTVMVYDACRAGFAAEAERGLTHLRRALP